MTPAELLDRRDGQPRLRLWNDVRLDKFAFLNIRYADYRHVAHTGQLADGLLDLDGEHVVAGRFDEILLAINNFEITVGIVRGNVARQKPAIANRRGGRRRVVQVAGHDL